MPFSAASSNQFGEETVRERIPPCTFQAVDREMPATSHVQFVQQLVVFRPHLDFAFLPLCHGTCFPSQFSNRSPPLVDVLDSSGNNRIRNSPAPSAMHVFERRPGRGGRHGNGSGGDEGGGCGGASIMVSRNPTPNTRNKVTTLPEHGVMCSSGILRAGVSCH